MNKTLIIGAGEIGTAVASSESFNVENCLVISRTLREHGMYEDSPVPRVVVELGVKSLPLELLDDVGAIIYAAGTPRPSALLNSTSVLVSDELAPLQALIEAIEKSQWRGSLVFASSGGTVYGQSQVGVRWSESDVCRPVSAYGIAKLTSENLLIAAATRYGFNLVVARISNIIGTRRNFERRIGFVQATVDRILKGRPIEIYGDGTTTRDFIDVRDVGSLLPSLGQYATVDGPIINVGTGRATNLLEVIRLVEAALNTSAHLDFQPFRPSDVAYNVLSNSKLTSLMTTDFVSLEDSVNRLIVDFSREIS